MDEKTKTNREIETVKEVKLKRKMKEVKLKWKKIMNDN